MHEPVRDAPAFDFYPERWSHGTKGMTKIERSDYLDLLSQQWTEDGIEDDLAMIAVSLGYVNGRGEGLPNKIPARVLAKFPVAEDGRRRNPFLEKLRQEQRGRITRKSEQRRAAALARWHPSQCDRITGADATALRAECPPPTTHPNSERESASAQPPPDGEVREKQIQAIRMAWKPEDNPLETTARIRWELEQGTDPDAMLAKVQAIAAVVETWPDGFNNRYVPRDLKFFSERQWAQDPLLWRNRGTPKTAAPRSVKPAKQLVTTKPAVNGQHKW